MKECTTHHNACDCREAEFAKLRAFAQDIMRAWPEGDVDGGELQDAALRHGLLRLKKPAPTEPCGENCNCATYYGDMSCGVACYELTELLSPNAGNNLREPGTGERQVERVVRRNPTIGGIMKIEVSEEQLDAMVTRFLSWRLPKPWNPDNGISYARPNYAHAPAEHDWPTGTNLFDAHQARQMVLHMLYGA